MINRNALLQAALLAVVGKMAYESYNYYFGAPDSPAVIEKISPQARISKSSPAPKGRVIKVSTDTLTAFIDKKGGRILKVSFAGYQQDGEDYAFFNREADGYLETQAGITGDESLVFSSPSSQYVAQSSPMTVTMQATGQQGVRYTKTFTFTPGKYTIDQTTSAVNADNEPVDVSSYVAFAGDHVENFEKRTPKASDLSFDKLDPSLAAATRGYTGISYTTKKKPYVRVKFADMEKRGADQTRGGWFAYQKHHFLSAWVLEQKGYRINNFWQEGLASEGSDTFEQRFVSQAVSGKVSLMPGESLSESATLYVGPQKLSEITSVDKSLRLTMDYGFFWMIANFLHKALNITHNFIPGWTWSLIALTAFIRLLFFNATKNQAEQVAQQKRMAPEVAALEKRFEGRSRFDQEKNEAMIALYKKHNVKMFSLSHFLPMLQIPLMIAFYGMIAVASEFRSESFLWLSDVSMPDPFYILPVVACFAMYLQNSQMNSGGEFQSVARYMPLLFVFFLAKAPGALQIYLAANTMLAVVQTKLTPKPKTA